MKLLIQLLLIISIVYSLKFRKFLNLKHKVFLGKFFEIYNYEDEIGQPIPLFTNEGELTDDGFIYYDMFSRQVNGEKVGTIITGETSVGKNIRYGYARINDDKFIPEHKYLVDLVHKNEADIIVKLINFMDYDDEVNYNETEIIPLYNIKITKMTNKESIISLEYDFINGVLRAKQSGYDGVMICLNGKNNNNLLNFFISPEINKREDEYGGKDAIDRARILAEIIAKIRKEIGNEFPLGLLVSIPDGYLGINDDDIIAACKSAEKSGIDFIQIDTGETPDYIQVQSENEINGRPLLFIKKLYENIKKIPIIIIKRGILRYEDLKTLAEIGVKF